MRVLVRLPSALRLAADTASGPGAPDSGSAPVVVSPGGDGPVPLRLVLDALAAVRPAAERRIRDERGALRRHVRLYVGAEDARDLGGLDALVGDGDEVVVLPALSGG